MRPEELASAIAGLHEWALRNVPAPEPELPRRVAAHLGTAPSALEVLSADFSSYDHVNFQVALDALREEPGVEIEILGLSTERGFRAGLAEIAQGDSEFGAPSSAGPVEYAGVDVGDRTVPCIKAGLLLIAAGDERLVVLVSPPDMSDPEEGEALELELMATRRGYAEEWLARLRALMRERNVYRGKVVAFGGRHPFRPAPLTVRRLPEIPRERIVLPEGTLERIERHTAGFARHRDALRAAGRHIKRGVLLHGPPGTGKTLTIMYLAGLMPERTVILLTGQALGNVTAACQLARSLEPAMVVLEDVDLVALSRVHMPGNPLLYELLDAMDGLDEDADLIFALTTNRPELLEPALAHRPGRIDLAVELPLPDPGSRRRLLELYCERLDPRVDDWEPVVAATDGTSAAFIREVTRRAAVHAIERDGGPSRVSAEDLMAAVEDLKHRGGRLTRSLLGAEPPPEAALGDFEEEDDLLMDADFYDVEP